MMSQHLTLWRHKRTRGVYVEVATASMEETEQQMVVYRLALPRTPAWEYPKDHIVWVRPAKEFYDGRFERLDTDAVRKWLSSEAPDWISPI